MDIDEFESKMLPLIERLEARSGRHTTQGALIHLIEEIGEVART